MSFFPEVERPAAPRPARVETPIYDWAALELNEGSITIETTPLITAQENVRSIWAQ